MAGRALTPSCKRCGAPVLFLNHEKTGNPAAIDPEPVLGGNITVDPERATYRILSRDERALSPHRALHKAHVVTCIRGPVVSGR